jgi:hypothetical protein
MFHSSPFYFGNMNELFRASHFSEAAPGTKFGSIYLYIGSVYCRPQQTRFSSLLAILNETLKTCTYKERTELPSPVGVWTKGLFTRCLLLASQFDSSWIPNWAAATG